MERMENDKIVRHQKYFLHMSKQGLITNSKLLLKHLLPFLWLVYREEITITQVLYLLVIAAVTPLQLSVVM